MNCIPGDLACIVRLHGNGRQIVPSEVLGAFVTVKSSFMGDEGDTLWSLAEPLYFVLGGDIMLLNTGQRFYAGDTLAMHCVPDSVLQPIRGLPVGSLTKRVLERSK